MTQECIGAEHKCWWVLNTQGGKIKAEQAVTRRNLYRYSDVSESARETWIRDLDWGQTCQSSRSLLVVSVNFISEYSWNTGWGQRVVLLLTLNWTDGPQPAKEPVKKKTLQSRPPVVGSPSANLLYFNKKICIANGVWWTGRYQWRECDSGGVAGPRFSTLEAIAGLGLIGLWHWLVTPDVLSIRIKAKVRTITCQYSSGVLWETHQLLKGTFCSSYCSSRGLRFL